MAKDAMSKRGSVASSLGYSSRPKPLAATKAAASCGSGSKRDNSKDTAAAAVLPVSSSAVSMGSHASIREQVRAWNMRRIGEELVEERAAELREDMGVHNMMQEMGGNVLKKN